MKIKTQRRRNKKRGGFFSNVLGNNYKNNYVLNDKYKVPSIDYCETGKLKEGETYNQNIHNAGETPEERCKDFYDITPKQNAGKRNTKRNGRRCRN
jgi:hypothetical protein